MVRLTAVLFASWALTGCGSGTVGEVTQPEVTEPPNVEVQAGRIQIQQFTSAISDSRQIEIWLPPGYDEDPEKHYPVLYMHDGQNVFNPDTSFTGIDWGVDETMAELIAKQEVRAAIVVAISNTPRRAPEYIPLATNLADKYLKLIVDELIPHINQQFRTLDGPENTFIMGASLGGLISAYAMIEYPQVFGGAGCVSTHWPVYDQIPGKNFIRYMLDNPIDPTNHKFYFDYGTKGLDAQYEPFQLVADEAMQTLGYTKNLNWVTRKFQDADHNEASWAARVHIPLTFLLGIE